MEPATRRSIVASRGGRHGREHQRGRLAAPRVARAPAHEPAGPRPDRGDLAAAPQLRGDGARRAEPGHGAHAGARARGAVSRPQRDAHRGRIRAGLSRNQPRRPADGGDAARTGALASPARAVHRRRARPPLGHRHVQCRVRPVPGDDRGRCASPRALPGADRAAAQPAQAALRSVQAHRGELGRSGARGVGARPARGCDRPRPRAQADPGRMPARRPSGVADAARRSSAAPGGHGGRAPGRPPRALVQHHHHARDGAGHHAPGAAHRIVPSSRRRIRKARPGSIGRAGPIASKLR